MDADRSGWDVGAGLRPRGRVLAVGRGLRGGAGFGGGAGPVQWGGACAVGRCAAAGLAGCSGLSVQGAGDLLSLSPSGPLRASGGNLSMEGSQRLGGDQSMERSEHGGGESEHWGDCT